ncbi:MAG: hypothetical protein ACPL7K_02880 [Armatimonadota bacterium]
MERLWQIISLIVSLIGFALVGTLNVLGGACAWEAALRAVIAFAVLWKVLSLMRGLLSFADEGKPAADDETTRSVGRTGGV